MASEADTYIKVVADLLFFEQEIYKWLPFYQKIKEIKSSNRILKNIIWNEKILAAIFCLLTVKRKLKENVINATLQLPVPQIGQWC